MRRRRLRRRPFRSRRRRLGRLRLRRGSRIRVRRNRTRIVNAVYDLESLPYVQCIPGQTRFGVGGGTGGSPTIATGTIGGWYGTTGSSSAYAIACCFNLYTLGQCASSYNNIAPLYDWVKLRKVTLVLKPAIDPKRDMTVALGASNAQYDFTGALVYDPDITVCDWDGLVLPRAMPANGDATTYMYNRTGAKRHRAFSTIRRTFYPRNLDMHPFGGNTTGGQQSPGYPNIINTGGGYVTSLSLGYTKGRRYGWCANNFDNQFTGVLCVFFSYKGPSGSTVQPFFNYGIQTLWYISYRDIIYG